MSKEFIIISDTEEPGAFDRESGCAVIKVPYDTVYRWSVLTDRLKEDHTDFSELRLWGSFADFYESQTPEMFLDALETIPEVERNAPEGPRITLEEVAALRATYDEAGYFVWPSGKVEFDLLSLCNMAALVYDEEQSEDEPDTMSVDIEEVVAEHGDFRFGAYLGDQQVYTKNVPYAAILEPVTA